MSYARDDSLFVLNLVKQLKLLGANLFVDQSGIGAGEGWQKTIEEAIRTSAGIIVAISPKSVKSDYVRREWSFALKIGIRVIPVLIEDAVVPDRLKPLEYVDFTTGYSDAISKIIKALKLDKPAGLKRILISHDLINDEHNFIEWIVKIVSSFGILPVIRNRSVTDDTTEELLKTLDDCDALLCIP